MDKLILPCGRYIPRFAGDTEIRLRAMEAYLARLSEELEVLLGETTQALASLQAAQSSLASVNTNREGGA